MSADIIKNQLALSGDSHKATFFHKFFKAGKGQYGEGDCFFGCTVPQVREIAKYYKHIHLEEIKKLLDDPVHECRMCALVILTHQFMKADHKNRQLLYNFYLTHTYAINNWDLVDLSAYKIVGEWLKDKDRNDLYRLAESQNMWEQRISVVSTYAFIRQNDYEDTIALCEKQMPHKHDLIHKACGWMLREVGKRNKNKLVSFLDKNSMKMPRTMLRYSIEKLTAEERIKYMKR